MSLPSVTRTRPADTLAMVRVLVFAGPVELKGIKSRLAPEAAPNLKVPAIGVVRVSCLLCSPTFASHSV